MKNDDQLSIKIALICDHKGNWYAYGAAQHDGDFERTFQEMTGHGKRDSVSRVDLGDVAYVIECSVPRPRPPVIKRIIAPKVRAR